MGQPSNANRIWKYEDVKVKKSGVYVKLTAPCAMSRRVTAETARRIAADLIEAADDIDEAAAVMASPGVRRGLEGVGEME